MGQSSSPSEILPNSSRNFSNHRCTIRQQWGQMWCRCWKFFPLHSGHFSLYKRIARICFFPTHFLRSLHKVWGKRSQTSIAATWSKKCSLKQHLELSSLFEDLFEHSVAQLNSAKAPFLSHHTNIHVLVITTSVRIRKCQKWKWSFAYILPSRHQWYSYLFLQRKISPYFSPQSLASWSLFLSLRMFINFFPQRSFLH